MNYEKMTKAELISKLNSLESGTENSSCREEEIAFQGSEDKYHNFIETLNDAVFLVDVETGIILETNKSAENLLGMPVEKIVGMHFTQVHPTEDIEKNKKLFLKYSNLKNAITSEDIFILHKDGRKIPVEISLNIFSIDGRKVLQGICRDISYHKHVEKKIKLSESKYRSLFENMLNGYAYCKMLVDENNKPIDFVYLEVNDAFETLTGLKKDLVIGRKVTEVMPGIRGSKPDLFEIYGKVALTGEGTSFDIFFEPLKIWFSISVYCPQKGYFVAVFDNITERKKTEELLKSSGDYLQKLNDSLGAAIFTVKIPERVIEYVNSAVENVFGYKRDECIGKITEIFYPTVEKYHDFGKTLKGAIKEGKNELKEEILYKRKNGEIFPCEVTTTFIKENEKTVRVISILQDITERRQAEEKIKKLNETLEERVLERTEKLANANKEIKESEARFQSILSSLYEAAIVIFDRDGKIMALWGTPEMDKRHGITSAEAVGSSLRDVLYPEHKEQMLAHIRNVIDTGEKILAEHIITVPGGNFWHEIALSPMRDPNDNITAVVGFIRDITKRKQSEKDIHKKNSYIKFLQVAAVAANQAEDIKDAFLPVLKEICSYTGWEIGHAYAISENNPDLLKSTEVWCIEEQKKFMEFCTVTKKTDFVRGVGLPGRVLASCKPHWITDVTTDSNFPRTQIALDLNIKSGIAFPVMVASRVVAVLEFFTTQKVEPDQQFMEIMADVGTQLGRTVERKNAETALCESFELNKKIISESPIGIAIYDQAGQCIEANTSFAKMINATREQVLAQNYKNIESWKRSGLLEIANRSIRLQVNDRHEFDFVTTFGKHAFLDCTLVPFMSNGKQHLFLIIDDITKRKQMEVALIQSEKMKAMGIMTAGVAHEFNNILAVISSNAQFLEETNRSDKELSKSLRTICRMSDDGAEIVDRMYDFTNINKDTSLYVSVDLHDLTKQVIGFTMPRWKEMAQADGITYQIVWKGARLLPSVLGNPSELREVILNIINNALDAMPDGGTITVKTRCVRSDGFGVESKKENISKLPARPAGGHTQNSKRKGDFVEITFTDNGEGMTDEIKNRMFDPFFTTKRPQGTGLGMSVSYGIILRHGGQINIESELGKGSVINLRLSVAGKHIPHVVTSGQESESNVDSLKILLVDDKEEICESLGKIFIDDGHKVSSINNGSDAIKLLKKNSYDLLICDLVMPDVNGRDILNAMKTMDRRPKVGLITGWRYKMEDAEKDGLEVDFIVKKPFNLSKLRRDINDLWI